MMSFPSKKFLHHTELTCAITSTRFGLQKKNNRPVYWVAFGLGWVLAGCGDAVATEAPDRVQILGSAGTISGLFVTPRGVAYDADGYLYVVDRTGRVQKFSPQGEFCSAFRVPEIENGRPTSLTLDAKGNLWIADTHYHRVLKYSPEGKLTAVFGREGQGPGEFIYPVGIQTAPDGTLFVSEFGGNDRIQVFDSGGRVLRAWGRYGDKEGEFKRPQALVLWKDRLYVADSANHRVLVFDVNGRQLLAFGKYGEMAGELKYPYGLAVGSDTCLYVTEYGNNRVQRFSLDGRSLGVQGGPGTIPGRLHTPWGLAGGPEGKLAVADAGNHRVQIWAIPSHGVGVGKF